MEIGRYELKAPEIDVDAAVAEVQARLEAWRDGKQPSAGPDPNGTNPGSKVARNKSQPKRPADAEIPPAAEPTPVPQNVDPVLKAKWERQNQFEADYDKFSEKKFGDIAGADWVENVDVKPGGKVKVRISLKHPLESYKISRALERMGFEVEHSAESPEEFVAARQHGRAFAAAVVIPESGVVEGSEAGDEAAGDQTFNGKKPQANAPAAKADPNLANTQPANPAEANTPAGKPQAGQGPGGEGPARRRFPSFSRARYEAASWTLNSKAGQGELYLAPAPEKSSSRYSSSERSPLRAKPSRP